MAPGEWMVYCDSTMLVESDIKQYLQQPQLRGSNAIVFRLGEAEAKGYTNGAWSKPGMFDAMGMTHDKYKTCWQLNAGMIMLKKTDPTITLVDEWVGWCSNPSVISDDGPPAPKEHRHDQSILTALCQHHKDQEGCGYSSGPLVEQPLSFRSCGGRQGLF